LVQGIDATGFTPGKHIFLLFFFVFNIICARIRQSRAPLFYRRAPHYAIRVSPACLYARWVMAMQSAADMDNIIFAGTA
jgi:hypothetical protein